MDGVWLTPVEEEVKEEVEIQSEATYIDGRHGTVAQWVVLCSIFEVCAR